MNGKLSKMMYPGKFSAQIVFLVIYYVLMILVYGGILRHYQSVCLSSSQGDNHEVNERFEIVLMV